MRRLALWPLTVLLTACSCGAASGAGSSPTPGHDVRPFTGWNEPGVHLFVECESAADMSACSVYGEDERGQVVDGPTLFVRSAANPALDPVELARRAEALLLGESGAEPVLPDAPPNAWVTPEEQSLVRAPTREGGQLVYFRVEGEMSPTLMRVTIDLATGVVLATENVRLLYAQSGPPIGSACEPRSTCGCEQGCGSFTLVETGDGQRFRDASGQVFFRTNEGYPLRSILDETCTGSCPPGPAVTRCVVIDGHCQAEVVAAVHGS